MTDTSDPLAILDAIDRERGDSSIGMIQSNQVQRLRTEIVALRRTIMLGPDLPALAREQALEEAAKIVEAHPWHKDRELPWRDKIIIDRSAAAIRALKEKH